MTAALTYPSAFAPEIDFAGAFGKLRRKLSLTTQFARSAVSVTGKTLNRISSSLSGSAKPMILGMAAGAGAQMAVKAVAAHFVVGAMAATLPAAATTLIVGAIAGGSAFAAKQAVSTYFYNRTHADSPKSYRAEIFGREALAKMATSIIGGMIGAEWVANSPAVMSALQNTGHVAAVIGGIGASAARNLAGKVSETFFHNLISKKGRQNFFSKQTLLGTVSTALVGAVGIETLIHCDANMGNRLFGFVKNFNPISSAQAEELKIHGIPLQGKSINGIPFIDEAKNCGNTICFNHPERILPLQARLILAQNGYHFKNSMADPWNYDGTGKEPGYFSFSPKEPYLIEAARRQAGISGNFEPEASAKIVAENLPSPNAAATVAASHLPAPPPTAEHIQIAETVAKPAIPLQVAANDSAAVEPVGRDSWRAQPGDPEYVLPAKVVAASAHHAIEAHASTGIAELHKLKNESYALINQKYDREAGIRVLQEAVDAAKKQGLENTPVAEQLARDLKFMEANPNYGMQAHNVVPIRHPVKRMAFFFKKAA